MEAVVLSSKKKLAPIRFEIEGVSVLPQKAIKYLGVWLHSKMTFGEHISRTAAKTAGTVARLERLMPNVGGSSSSRRRMLCSVAHSQLLYAAPIWEHAMQTKRHRQKLASLQRKLAIRVSSAYRMVSTAAVGVIAGIPSIHLMVEERRETCGGTARSLARQNLLSKWNELWSEEEHGRWTYCLIPDVKKWHQRGHGEVGYGLTQVLSGHGCFRGYLSERRRAEDDRCAYCGEVDTAEHTMFKCGRWSAQRLRCELVVGRPITMKNLVDLMLESETKWNGVANEIHDVITTKEEE